MVLLKLWSVVEEFRKCGSRAKCALCYATEQLERGSRGREGVARRGEEKKSIASGTFAI